MSRGDGKWPRSDISAARRALATVGAGF